MPRRKKYNIAYIAFIVLFACSLISTGIAAKYVYKQIKTGKASSPFIYFTSNLLREDNPTYTLNSDMTQISFTLANCADELRFSDVDIDYEVTVETAGPDCVIENGEGQLAKNGISQETITIKNVKKGQTYKVTAVGKNGFEIELSATFKIMEDGGFYKNTDISNGSYVLLTVWTLNMNGDVKIEFPAGLIPDNTDPRMANVHNYVDGQYVAYVFNDVESFGDTNKKSSSHVYRFFKTAEFAGSTDFTVTLIDHESQSEAEETLLE